MKNTLKVKVKERIINIPFSSKVSRA